MTTPIRVVVADDHPLILRAVQDLCRDQRDIRIVATCRNGEEALEAARTLEPDVLLLDISMPELDGLEVLRRIRGEGRPTRVVFLTAALDEDELLEAMVSA